MHQAKAFLKGWLELELQTWAKFPQDVLNQGHPSERARAGAGRGHGVPGALCLSHAGEMAGSRVGMDQESQRALQQASLVGGLELE